MIAHGGNPVLRWMAANIAVEVKSARNVKPTNIESREKIKGIVTLGRIQHSALVTSIYEE